MNRRGRAEIPALLLLPPARVTENIGIEPRISSQDSKWPADGFENRSNTQENASYQAGLR